MDARSLVLMERENGILANELGSYEVENGLEYVDKAYVEDEIVNLFVTTNKDVDDEEYNEIFDGYNADFLVEKGYEVEEVEDYNPVWCVRFEYKTEYSHVASSINEILNFHESEMKRLFEEIKK